MILWLDHVLGGFYNILAILLILAVLQTISLGDLFDLGDDSRRICNGSPQGLAGCFYLELKFHVLVGLVDFVLDDVGEDGVLCVNG